MQPWKTLAKVQTAEGLLELRQRGKQEMLIVIDGRVLMTSKERRSEQALAQLACEPLAGRRAPRILIGGLGMGYTLRAALDALPRDARVTVAEITPEVEAWCRGPLAPLTDAAVADPRVRVVIDDVARVIAGAPRASWDAIVLDLYEGPHAATQGAGQKSRTLSIARARAAAADDPFYSAAALGRMRAALAPGGALTVWSEEADDAFGKRFAKAGFRVQTHRLGSTRTHVVYYGVSALG